MNDLDLEYLEGFKTRYMEWLWEELGFGPGYSALFELLYQEEFTWTIPMDENRAVDGVYLRDRFCYETGDHLPDGWRDWPCSVLEMMASLAFAMEESFLYDPESVTGPDTWLWELLDNCGLSKYDDRLMARDPEGADAILATVLDRGYSGDGSGGLFPLRHPFEDQRNVEIWFQMNAYISENLFGEGS